MQIPVLRTQFKWLWIIPMFLLALVFFVGKNANAQSYWVQDPASCPTTYSGQSCSGGEVICGIYSNDFIECYDYTALNQPLSTTTIETNNPSGSNTGGYWLDCYDNDEDGEPLCDNSGNWWCNRDASCYDVNRVTECYDTSFACGDCRSGYYDCNGLGDGTDGDGCEINAGVTSCTNGTYNSSCGCSCDPYYYNCNGDETTCDWGGYNIDSNHYHFESACATSSATCDTDYLDCDGDLTEANIDAGTTNGCEIHDGSACTTSYGEPGVIMGCSAGGANCVPSVVPFETGTEARYATSTALLWGTQYGSGPLMKLTSDSASTTGGVFFIDNSGQVGIGTSTLGAGNMLTVGYDPESQFIINDQGSVISGTWQGGVIDLAYGGTGADLASTSGFLYADNDTTIASSTIHIGNTDLSPQAPLNLSSNILSLDTSGNWTGTIDNIDFGGTLTENALWYGSSGATPNELTLGGDGEVLMVRSGSPAWASTTDINALGTIRAGTWEAGIIDAAYGGTGRSSWTQYAIPYLTDATTFGQIGIGGSNQVLAVNSSADGYTWVDASSTGAMRSQEEVEDWSGELMATTTGLHELISVTYNDNGSDLGSMDFVVNDDLSFYDNSASQFFSTTTDVLGPAYGGTGRTSWTQNALLYMSDSTTFGQVDIGSADHVLAVNSSGSGYTWVDASSTGSMRSREEVEDWSGELMATTTGLHELISVIYNDNGEGPGSMDLIVDDDLSQFDNSASQFFSTTTDVLSPAYGGTGRTSWTQNALLYMQGPTQFGEIEIGGSDEVLAVNSSGDGYTWVAATSTGSMRTREEIEDWSADLVITASSSHELITVNYNDNGTDPGWLDLLVERDLSQYENATSSFITLANLQSAATGLEYDDSTGTFSLNADYNIPLIASTSNWNWAYDYVNASSTLWDTAYSWGDHASAGYFVTASDVLPITSGGTGTTTAAGARVNLGLEIGSDVQGWDDDLSDIASQAALEDNFLVANASNNWTSVGTSTVRSTLGLGSLALQNAGSVNISGGTITGITDLAVTDGGTGRSSWTPDGIIYASSSDEFAQIPIGTADYLLSVNAAGDGYEWVEAGSVGMDTTLSDEEVEDISGPLMATTTGTHTLITVNYNDNGTDPGSMDFIVNDNLSLYDNSVSQFFSTSTDILPIAYGGTGSTTAAGARANLGLTFGQDILGFDQGLSDIAGLATTSDLFMIANGTTWDTQGTSTVRSTLGLNNIYSYGINSIGASGELWMADGDGRGTWAATSSLNLSLADTYGTLPVNRGGTGRTSWTAQGIVFATTSSQFSQIPIGSADYLLSVNAAGDGYEWIEAGSVGVDTTLTDEEVEDISGPLMATTTGTHSLITVSYNDNGGDPGYMDFVVNPDLSLYNNSTSQFFSTTTDVLAFPYGGTGLTSISRGQTLYADADNSLAATSSLFIDPSGNIGIGTTSITEALTLDGNFTISGNIMPHAASSSNIGSNAKRFANGYFENLYAENMFIASTSISGSAANYFIVNSDNVTDDTEDSGVEFERGSAIPNALLRWNSTDDIFTFNFPLGLEDQNELRLFELAANGSNYVALRASSSLDANTVWTLPGDDGSSGQALLTDSSGNLYWGDPQGSGVIHSGLAGQIPYYAGDGTALTATSTIIIGGSGMVGIGTDTPSSQLTVEGDIALTGTVDGYDISNYGDYFIDSAGTDGYLWRSNGSGRGSWIATGSLNIAIGDTTGTVPVSRGGTGQTNWTQYAIPYLTDSTTFGEHQIGAANQILAVNASGNGYTWVEATSTGTMRSQEEVEDWAGEMVASSTGTHTLITVNYNDDGLNPGYMDFVVNDDLSLYDNSVSQFFSTTTDVLAPAYGGTGLSSYAAGDLLAATSSTELARIAAGEESDVLRIVNGSPAWVSASSSGIGTDVYVAVDGEAAPGYLGAAADGGVLRADSTLSYTDGGDYITLGVAQDAITDTELAFDTGQHLTTTSAPTFIGLTLTGFGDNLLTVTGGQVGTTTNNITNWDWAYSYVNASSTNWDTAYGWGDHAAQNYFDLDNAPLEISQGGTGADASTTARANLGLAIGSDVQAWDNDLDDLAGLSADSNYFIVGNGTDWITQSTSTARSTLGLGTLARQDADSVSISGGTITGITDLAVADGGTGRSSWTQYAIPYLTDSTTFGEHQIGSADQILAVNSSGDGYTWVEATSTGTMRSQEEVEDWSGELAATTTGAHSLITVNYNDNGNSPGWMDFIVNPDLSQYDNATSSFITLESLDAENGLAYATSSGLFSVAAGYNIPMNASTSNWNWAYNYVNASSTNWDTAYGWGDHASAGYFITASDVLPITSGGTGSTTAQGARENLGLDIGVDIMGYDASLADFAGLTADNNYFVVGGGGDDWTGQSTSSARSILGLSNIYSYGIDSSGALGEIWMSGGDGRGSWTATSALRVALDDTTGILPIARGGTGSSTAQGARVNLGLEIGTNVQAWDGDLDNLSLLTPQDDYFITGNASGDWEAISTTSVTSSLGLADAYNYSDFLINSAGSVGELWMSDGTGRGGWTATSTLNVAIGDTTGTVSVSRGGTGQTSWSPYAIPYLSDAATFSEIEIGSDGQLLSVNGAGDGYTWVSAGEVGQDTTLSDEEVEDISGALMATTTGTHSLITVNYNDNGNSPGWMDFIVNPDLSQYDNATSSFITLESLDAENGLAYATSSGLFSVAAGYNIPMNASTSNWNWAYNYVNASSTNWDTAYGWGDHATQNYFDLDGGPLSIGEGGTGAATTSDARSNLGLVEAYAYRDYFIRSAGTDGYIWQSDGIDAGQWVSTTTLGLLGEQAVAGLSSDYLSKWDGSGFTDSLIYDNGSFVGIGTTSPASMLDVAGAAHLRGADGQIGLYVDSQGFVGAGTTSLSDRMTVDGSIAVTGLVDGYDISSYGDYFIDSAGTDGYLWRSTGAGRGQWIATGSLNIAINDTVGTVPVNRGGTGQTSWTPEGIVYASSSDEFAQIPIGTADYLLSVNSSGDGYEWVEAGSVGMDTQRSREEIEDWSGQLMASTTGTHTLITVNYNDDTSSMDFVVNDDLSLYDNSTSQFFSTTTDILPVAYGGTGSTTAAGARENLGLAYGSDILNFDQGLSDIAGLATTSDLFMIANGTTWDTQGTSTVRSTLGLSDIYGYGINSAGSSGELWMSDGDGRGGWIATSTLGLLGEQTVGGLTANYLSKWDGSQLTNSMVYDTGSYVGIGTTSPQALLDVVGSGEQMRLGPDGSNYVSFAVDGAGQFQVQPTSGYTLFNTPGTQNFLQIYDASGSNYLELTHDGTNASITSNSGELQFGTAGDFIIDAGVNVGIGTTSPDYPLTVNGDAFVGGLTATGTITLNGITYTFPSSQGSDYYLQTDGAGNLSWADVTGSSGAVGYGEAGALAFYDSTGTTATGTDPGQLSWDSTNGRLGIGTSAPLAMLTVNGNLLLEGSSNYLNFGTSTGAAGYGFRDDSGAIQYRSRGGTWADLSSLGAGELNDLSDVTITAAADGEILMYDGSNWVDTATSSLGLMGLDYVNSLTANYLSRWDGSKFVNSTLYDTGANVGIGTTSPLSKLTVYGDLLLEGTDRYINFGTETGTSSYGFRDYAGTMQYKNQNGEWVNIGSAGSSGELGSMADVDVSTASSGDLVYYDGSQWVDIATSSLGLMGLDYVNGLTANYVPRWDGSTFVDSSITDDGSLTVAMTGGNLGIGTTTPSYALDLVGSGNLFRVATSGGDVFTITDTQITSNVPHTFTGAGNIDVAGEIYMSNTSQANLSSYGPMYLTAGDPGSDTNLYLEGRGAGAVYTEGEFTATGTTTLGSLLYVNSQNDRVGVGTSSPLSLLDIYGNLTLSGSDRYINFASAGTSTGYGLRDSSGSLQFKHSGGSWADLAALSAAGSQGQVAYFASDGSSLTGTSSIYIANSGNVGIGTTSPSGFFTVGSGASPLVIDSSGTVTSGTWQADTLGLAYGGTGAADAAGARSNLGLAIGSDVQAYSQKLYDIAQLSTTSDLFIVSNGSTWSTQGTSTVVSTLGLSGMSDYAINSVGTDGQVWLSGGSGRGSWAATSTLGLMGLDYVSGLTANYATRWNGSSFVDSTIYDTGTLIGIGTSSPSSELTVYGDLLLEGTDRYLNFGTSTGSTGYGFRDSSGTLQYKNAGGSWTNIGSAGSAGELGSMSDVDVTGATSGSMVSYNGSTWVDVATSSLGLMGLDYVNGLTANYIPRWDGTSFVDSSISDDGSVTMGLYDGKLGIGTTTPTNALTVFSTSGSQLRLGYDASNYVDFEVNAAGEFSITSSGSSGSILQVGAGDAENAGFVIDGNVNDYWLALDDSDGSLKIGTSTIIGSSSVLTVLNSGNVGIGTTTPDKRLTVDGLFHIAGTGTSTIDDNLEVKGGLKVGEASTYIDSDSISFTGGSSLEDNAGVLTLQPGGGYVGIGTSTPSHSLQVSGTVYADQFVSASSSSFSNITSAMINKVINVDGETYSADGAGIQQAINDVPAGGGKVFIPAGTYTLTASVTIPSYVWLEGAGKNSTILELADNVDAPMLYSSSSEYVRISSMRLNGNNANNSGDTTHGIYFENATRAKVFDVYIYDVDDFGIRFMNTDYSIAESCIIEDSGQEGIFSRDSNYNSYINNKVTNSGGYGIRFRYSDYNRVEYNNVENATGFGIDFCTGTDNSIALGNIVSNSTSHGIAVYNNNNIVADNRIEGAGEQGIYVTSDDNVIQGNNITGSTNNGIYINDDNNLVTDNRIEDSGASGVYLTGSADNNHISGNRISDTSGSDYAIEIAASGSNNSIANNNFEGFTGTGLVSDSGTDTAFTMKERIDVTADDTTFNGPATALTVTQSGTGDIMNLYDGSTEVFTVLDGGNVGIGTTTPGARLHAISTNTQMRLGYDSSNYTNFEVDSSGNLSILPSNTSNNVTIEQFNNFGLGTTTPQARLSVEGDGAGVSKLAHFTDGNGQGLMTLQENGYLGLGDASPDYYFDLQGSTTDYMASIYNTSGSSTAGGLNIRSDGEGSLLNLNYNGTDVFTVTGAQSTFNHPVSFAGSGDISVAQDLIMGNDTAGNIKFNGPGYIMTDSGWENLDLTLSAANRGYVVVDDTLQVAGHLIPDTDNIYDLGTTTAQWRNLLMDGRIGIGTTSPQAKLSIVDTSATNTDNVVAISTSTSGHIFRITGDGNVYADGTFNNGGADYAEYFYTQDTDLKAGEAVCVNVAEDNSVERCRRGADGNLMGIVSTKPAIVGNAKDGYDNNVNYKIVGMLGQVPARVSSENGPIRPGDSLTSASSTSGHVMRADPGDPTVGVALEAFDSDVDTINVLISRRNKSLTVEQVEKKVTDRIAAMEIEDEVRILVSNAVDDYNVASSVQPVIDEQLAAFDSELTVAFNKVEDKIMHASSSLSDVIARVNTLSGRVTDNTEILKQVQNDITALKTQTTPTSDTASSSITMINRENGLLITNIASSSVIARSDSDAAISSTTPSSYASTTDSEVAIVEIDALTRDAAAFVVNQQGDGDVADFRSDDVSIMNIADTGKVTVVGEMMVDGRIMVCSGGACGSALDSAVDETMGDMGVEGKVVAGAYESYCKDGYVWVPGSSKYGTLPGFCVETDEHGYENGSTLSTDIKWDNLTMGEAQITCQEQGEGYHLLTEGEYLTLAENIIRTSANDTDPFADGLQLLTYRTDSPGTTGVTGQADEQTTDDSASTTVIASDSEAISSSTETVASTTESIIVYEYATSSDIIFTLSNGNQVYNLAGGLAEWTDRTLTRSSLPVIARSDSDEAIPSWTEYHQITDYQGMNLNPPYYYTYADNGIGRIRTGTATSTPDVLRGFVRGASALYDLDLSYSPTTATSGVGFRCAR